MACNPIRGPAFKSTKRRMSGMKQAPFARAMIACPRILSSAQWTVGQLPSAPRLKPALPGQTVLPTQDLVEPSSAPLSAQPGRCARMSCYYSAAAIKQGQKDASGPSRISPWPSTGFRTYENGWTSRANTQVHQPSLLTPHLCILSMYAVHLGLSSFPHRHLQQHKRSANA